MHRASGRVYSGHTQAPPCSITHHVLQGLLHEHGAGTVVIALDGVEAETLVEPERGPLLLFVATVQAHPLVADLPSPSQEFLGHGPAQAAAPILGQEPHPLQLADRVVETADGARPDHVPVIEKDQKSATVLE